MNRRTISRALTFSILVVGTAVGGADPPGAPGPATPAPPASAATNAIGPKIQFETPVHDFGRAKSGEQVKYTYALTNAGDQVLEISGVQACGCITADWTRKVEPGKTGSIPISYNSAGYSGQIFKAVTVTCNDKSNPRPVLQLRGTIWKPVDVVPPIAVLNLTADAPLASATVRVINNLPEPITLSAPESNNRAIAAELKTIQPGKEFQVVIAPVSLLPPGSVQAQITLKTSSTNVPVVAITVFANVQPAVTINPPQIVLPAAPLAQPQTNTLTFINHSTNLLALSEPAVNASGVDVQLKEVVPGRQLVATLTFPQGFEVPAGQRAELSLKSSLPQMPALKVPILEAPRPAPPKAAPVKVFSSTATKRHRASIPVDLPPLPP
jgi:hypothetical protein